MREEQRSLHIMNCFRDAQKSARSVLIIDDMEILMKWTPDRRYLNRVLQTIKTMLVSLVDNEKMVVIINSNHLRELSSLSMFERITAAFDPDEFGRL